MNVLSCQIDAGAHAKLGSRFYKLHGSCRIFPGLENIPVRSRTESCQEKSTKQQSGNMLSTTSKIQTKAWDTLTKQIHSGTEHIH